MRRMGRTGLAMVFWAGTALAAPPPSERLAGGSLQGFVVGHNASNGESAIIEQVPVGETVQRWTRMVTTQRFGGLATRTTALAYVQGIAASVPAACPGARVSPVAGLSVSGRPAARLQVDCPRSNGGIPETFIMLAIAGQSAIYVKQVAFRGASITPANLVWGREFLASIVVCAPRDRQPSCQ